VKRAIILAVCLAATVGSVWLAISTLSAQPAASANPRPIPIGKGWARNSINTVIFRRNSITTHGNVQYAAFYDDQSNVVLAKRKLGTDRWQVYQTPYQGNTKDAHNSISIAVDGDGFLHMAWNHHNTPLQYCRSTSPGSLELTQKMPMTGVKENRMTYPEFYNLPNGNLLFLYRDGASGNGDLMMNHYDVRAKKWTRVQDGLISGEGARNAYWQMTVDVKGTIHLSWVWRESPDVASNHDMCYAKSTDSGKTWRKSSGEQYQLPITAKSAEYAWRIPPGSELINQTSMCADADGRAYIATYWRAEGTNIPQYRLIYHDGRQWKVAQISQRTTPFSLSGQGTRRIPISRPQIVIASDGAKVKGWLIFRDVERGDRVSVAVCSDLKSGGWLIQDLTDISVGMWEPTYDQARWESKKELHLLVQRVGQGEAEGIENLPPQEVSVLEWRPK